LTSSILNFVCLRNASSRFDGICDDLSKVIFKKKNFTNQYNGKGKVMFKLRPLRTFFTTDNYIIIHIKY
jgi:hypothetical protein